MKQTTLKQNMALAYSLWRMYSQASLCAIVLLSAVIAPRAQNIIKIDGSSMLAAA